MRPGSLSRQYNVCGKPGCRCKTPNVPADMAPITSSTMSIAVKDSRFIRREMLRQVRTELANYNNSGGSQNSGLD